MSSPVTRHRLRSSATHALGYVAASPLASPLLRLAARVRGASGFVVLTYHRLGGSDDPFFSGIAPEDFRRQMELLVGRWNVLPLSELMARAEAGTLPPRAAAITFDDNYLSVHELALPILRDVGLSATVFAPTLPLLDGGRRLWYDRVLHAFKHRRRVEPLVGVPGLETGGAADPGTRPDDAVRTLAWMKRLSEPARGDTLAQIEEALDPAPIEIEAGHRMAGWDELRTWIAAGCEVGAHTVSHPILAGLPRERVRTELVESRRVLEEGLRCPVPGFAYPNGTADDIDEAVIEEVAAAGYEYAFTTRPGINRAGWTGDRYRLSRLDATETSARHLMLRLAALELAA